MAVTIKLRFVRHSARKLRPVLSQFQGSNLEIALNRTAIMPNDSARFLNKALKMASAVAKDKQFLPEKMVISEIFATPGPKVKRIKPNARGRTNKYIKHLAHITVSLKSTEPGTDGVKPAEVKKSVETTVRKK